MSAPPTVDFSSPRHGWMQVLLESGDQRLVLDVSYTPFDSLEEVANALLAFLELLFEAGEREGTMRVSVNEHAFVHEGQAALTSRVFWRALRRLETSFDAQHWAHPFPSRLVEALGRHSAR